MSNGEGSTLKENLDEAGKKLQRLRSQLSRLGDVVGHQIQLRMKLKFLYRASQCTCGKLCRLSELAKVRQGNKGNKSKTAPVDFCYSIVVYSQ